MNGLLNFGNVKYFVCRFHYSGGFLISIFKLTVAIFVAKNLFNETNVTFSELIRPDLCYQPTNNRLLGIR